jgi:single-stranded DNA-binding protein
MTLNRLTLIGIALHGVLGRNEQLVEKRRRGNASQPTWHRCVANGKLAGFALTLKKGAHVHIEGELQSREFDKNGVTQKIFECRVRSILKLDRAIQQTESTEDEDSVV